MKTWQIKHHVSDEAIRELLGLLGVNSLDVVIADNLKLEAGVSQRCQLNASKMGGRLWRNNVGAGKLENGKFIRWGLCNETPEMNKHIKSSDRIGIKPVLITQEMVGKVIGQFWAVECKRSNWQYSDNNKQQARFLAIVNSLGGCGEFNNTGEFE